MLKTIVDYFSKPSASSKPSISTQPNLHTPYSSQAEMLQTLQREDEPGLCNPITNLYVESQITGKPDIFSKSNKDVYIDARIEEHHQNILRQEGKDGKHAAFIDTNTDFKVISVPVHDNFSLDVNEILPTQGHTMITFPVENHIENDPYHQVYLGKLKDDSCLSFDASIKGGKRIGDCQDLLNDFADQMSKCNDSNRPPKLVTIATSSFFSNKKIFGQMAEAKPNVSQSQNLF
jgi:hypothetical protein